MITIQGTEHKQNSLDIPVCCPSCGKLYYILNDCNGKWSECPYCKHKA